MSTSLKDLIEALYAADCTFEEEDASEGSSLAALGFDTHSLAQAQALQDCEAVCRPSGEAERDQLEALRCCRTLGDLLAWCNGDDRKGRGEP